VPPGRPRPPLLGPEPDLPPPGRGRSDGGPPGWPSERIPKPRRGGLSGGVPDAGGGSESRFREADRGPVEPVGRAFFGFRSLGFFGRGASALSSGSVTSGLHEAAPALPVAGVLDGDAPRGQLVTEPIRGRPVARRPSSDSLVEELGEIGLEVLHLVR
jgi:hypothetical protein